MIKMASASSSVRNVGRSGTPLEGTVPVGPSSVSGIDRISTTPSTPSIALLEAARRQDSVSPARPPIEAKLRLGNEEIDPVAERVRFDTNARDAVAKLNELAEGKQSFSEFGNAALVQVSHNHNNDQVQALIDRISKQLKEYGLQVAHYGSSPLDEIMYPPKKGYRYRVTLLLGEIFN